jgi:hypothetical protein
VQNGLGGAARDDAVPAAAVTAPVLCAQTAKLAAHTPLASSCQAAGIGWNMFSLGRDENPTAAVVAPNLFHLQLAD